MPPKTKTAAIVWTQSAEDDLAAVFAYGYATYGLDQAAAFEDSILAAVERLASYPESAQYDQATRTRSRPVGPYLIVYDYEGTAIKILTIAHGRREFPRESI